MSNNITQLTSSTFEKFINDNKLVIVDFWADWCRPCVMLAPILEEVAETLKGKAHVAKVNVDENKGLAQNFQVSSIPNVCIFKDGKLVDRSVGLVETTVIVDIVNKYI